MFESLVPVNNSEGVTMKRRSKYLHFQDKLENGQSKKILKSASLYRVSNIPVPFHLFTSFSHLIKARLGHCLKGF